MKILIELIDTKEKVFIYYLQSLGHYLLNFGKSPKPIKLVKANSE